MRWPETFRTALEAMTTRRLRSLLTVVGILIGIAAVMLTVGLGEGAQAEVRRQIDQLGSNLLIVAPGSVTSSTGVRAGRGSASTLTMRDAVLLSDHTVVPDVRAVAPVSTSSQPVVAGQTNWTTQVVGTTAAWPGVRHRTTVQGRFFTSQEVADGAQVAVLGSTTASQLYGPRTAVGQVVDVDGATLTVVGVLDTVGSSATADEDDQVLVPQTTYASRVAGSANPSSVSALYLQAGSQDTLSAAYQEADAALLTAHGVSPATPDFTISSQQSILEAATATDRTLTVLLGGVAAISLLVGGIGVMNIMLVSVAERVREIGLRKALGATPRAVRRQFLVEAGSLGVTGGLCGMALGLLGAWLLPRFLGQPVTISPVAAAGSLAVSLAIGLVAGVYPATRAARLSPIDALRSE